MKKLITLICIIALMAVPVIGNAAPAEKTISVKAYKPGQESTLSMANKSLNPEAKVVEKSEGKYIYTLQVKAMEMQGAKGHVTNLFVYIDGKKIEAKKEDIKGDYETSFTFEAPKVDKIDAAVWVDAMDKLMGGKPGAGEQKIVLAFNWGSDVKKPEPSNDGKMVTTPVGTDKLQVFVDGKQVKFDVKPFATNNRTLVPMRAIFEALGAKVTWDQTTKTAVAEKDGVVVKVQIGKAEGTIEKNGAKEVKQLDVSSMAKGGRTFVPLRFIGEAFGNKVDYKNVSGIGLINIMKEAVPAKP